VSLQRVSVVHISSLFAVICRVSVFRKMYMPSISYPVYMYTGIQCRDKLTEHCCGRFPKANVVCIRRRRQRTVFHLALRNSRNTNIVLQIWLMLCKILIQKHTYLCLYTHYYWLIIAMWTVKCILLTECVHAVNTCYDMTGTKNRYMCRRATLFLSSRRRHVV